MSRSRLFLLLALSVWGAVIAVATLTPAAYTPPLTWRTFLCVGCGWRGTADIIANWILFVPVGLALAWLVGGRRAVLWGVALTFVIEILQIGIPGRDPTLHDLLSNSLGALTGAAVARRGLGTGGRTALGIAAAVAWLAPAGLLLPLTSSRDLYGQWTPVFAQQATYRGRVLAASVGGAPVRSGRLSNKPDVDRAVVHRDVIALTLRVGPPPPSFAPVFQIVDVEQRAIVVLGASGSDLILWGHSPSRLLRLDQPSARWVGALTGVRAGDTVSVTAERGRASVCMSVAERTACGLAPALGDGWGHLVSLDAPPAWLTSLLAGLWATGLGLTLGGTSPGRRSALYRGATLGVVGLLAGYASPDVRPDVANALLLAAASVAGSLLRGSVDRVWRYLRAQEPLV